MIKLKDLLKEGTISLVGGMVSGNSFPTTDGIKLSNLVKEKIGYVEEEEDLNLKEFSDNIRNFGSMGKHIYREGNLKDVAKGLSELANQVRIYTLRETDEWFDKVTIGRNMKELTNLSKSFNKVATEAQSLQERMSGLYEDMGHILGRYYEIHEPGHEEEQVEGKSYRDGDELEADAVQEGTYEDFFRSALEKWGVSEPDQLDDEEKVKFFNYVDKNWSAKSETD